MEGKRSIVFILIAAVIILSIALAVLAGYIFIFAGTANNSEQTSVSNTYNNKRLNGNEIGYKKLFDQSKALNLKSEENKKASIILINLELEYDKSVKNAEAIITRHESKIKEIVATYFQKMTLDEAKDPQIKEKARTDLVELINDMIFEYEGNRTPLIYTIVFDEWFYQ